MNVPVGVRAVFRGSGAAVLVLAMACAAGCSGGQETESGPTGTGAGGRTSASSAVPIDIDTIRVDVEATRAVSDAELWSPAQWFLDGRRGQDDEFAEIERRTAACMRAEGWAYVPETAVFDGLTDTIGELRAYRAASGYGAFVSASSAVKAAAAKGEGTAAPGAVGADGVTRRGLTSRQRTAYTVALWGSPKGPDPDEPDLPDASAKGCHAQAARQVLTGLPRFDREVVEYLMANHPRRNPQVRRAWVEWSACMKAAGQPFADNSALNTRIEELKTQVRTDPSRRAAARAQEMEIARADVRCYVDHVHRTSYAASLALLSRLAQRFPGYAEAVRAVVEG